MPGGWDERDAEQGAGIWAEIHEALVISQGSIEDVFNHGQSLRQRY